MGFDFASILVAYGAGALPTLPAGGVRPPQQPKASQMTSLDLTGRTAIITGASRGIGLAIAQQLAAAGAHVVLTARRQEAADEAAAQVGDRALGVGAHAVDEDAARRCVDLTLERFGSVDILINNAGTNPAYGPLLEQDHARFAKIFDVNLWAPLMWTSLVVTAWMGEHGGAARWSTPPPSAGCTSPRPWACTTRPKPR